MTTKLFLYQLTLLTAVALLVIQPSSGFVVRRNGFPAPSLKQHQSTTFIITGSALFMAEDEDRLRALGYSEDEIKRSKKNSDEEEIKVRVDLIPEIDAVSLTAVGFGLIALNFFVFANMGDGGIAGIVAQIMNSM